MRKGVHRASDMQMGCNVEFVDFCAWDAQAVQSELGELYFHVREWLELACAGRLGCSNPPIEADRGPST